MRAEIASLAFWAVTAAASYNGNLNYRSPSLSLDHAGLGIDLAKVEKRMLQKRDMVVDPETLNFTHGVASVCFDLPS
jgi:alkaline phosphatase D